MKQFFSLTLAVLLLFALAACSASPSKSTDSSAPTSVSEAKATTAPTQAPESEAGPEDEPESEAEPEQEPESGSEPEQEPESEAEPDFGGTLGDYEVSILSARLAEDYEGNPAVIVKFEFTNHDEEARNFMFAISTEVYQDGVELETAIVMEDIENENSMKNIKTGATITCEKAYLLTSESEIEVELSELISFDNTKITRTFAYEELE